MGTGRDSEKAAKALKEEGAGTVIVFGGDGTNRDVAKGWPDIPLRHSLSVQTMSSHSTWKQLSEV